MNGWSAGRLAIYLATLGASLLAMSGLATFDVTTGDLDIHPFNVYAAMGAAGGAVSSGLAAIALLRGWGSRR
jgi:hypothetical protein